MNSDTDSVNTLQEDHESITLDTDSITLDTDSTTLDNENKSNYIKILPINSDYIKYYSKTKKTSPFLTKFEKTKLIGIRAQMISNGSEPVVNVPVHIHDSIAIAELEFEKKCIPLFVKRYISDNEYELWRPEDML